MSRRHGRGYHVDPDTIKKILALWKWGLGLEELHERFGLDESTLRVLLAKAGVLTLKAADGRRVFKTIQRRNL